MKHTIHKLICWYLRRCAGAFHCYNYGAAGRYVVLMTDDQYHVHQKTERVVREILIAHGFYGDGGNLDKLTRQKCLELLQPLDRHSNDKLRHAGPETHKCKPQREPALPAANG